jgi:hypothetical protein
MSNIDTLKSTIGKKGGFANTNRFEVDITFPNANTSAEVITLVSEAINFPGRQIETLDYDRGYRANTIKIPTGYSNEEFNITFRLTNDFFVKKLFDEWQRIIFNSRTQKVSYLKEYARDITIHSLNKENEKTFGVKMFDCYPTTVGAIEKTNESQDEILRMQVTFTFKDLERVNNSSNIVSVNLNDPNLFNTDSINPFRGIFV